MIDVAEQGVPAFGGLAGSLTIVAGSGDWRVRGEGDEMCTSRGRCVKVRLRKL